MRIKSTKAKGLSAAQLKAIAAMPHAAYSATSAGDTVVALIKRGGTSPEMREAFVVGHMARRLFPKLSEDNAIAKARAVRAMPGHDKAKPTDKGRRTVAQEQAYGAARKAWHDTVKRADGDATDNRGGANNKGKANAGKGKGKGKSTTPPAANDVAPKATDRETSMTYVTQQAVALLAYANKNAAVLPLDYAEAVKAFHKAIIAIKADKA